MSGHDPVEEEIGPSQGDSVDVVADVGHPALPITNSAGDETGPSKGDAGNQDSAVEETVPSKGDN
eukprot:1282539-Prorocentrum_lima.AAC.1